MTLSGGISQRGLVSKQKAWKISSNKQEECGIPFHAFLSLNFFGYLLLAIAFSYLQEIISLLLLFCKGCMRFINKHTLRQESNTASTVNYFSPAEKQSCCGRNITASYQRVYTQGKVGDGLRESFDGDFSCCTIENISLDIRCRHKCTII